MRIRLLLFGLLLQATAFAQNSLSGTWILQNKEHVSGPQYENALPKQVSMSLQGDSIIIESVDVDGVKLRQAIPANEQPFTYISSKSHRKLIKNIKWASGRKGIAFTIVFHAPNNPTEVEFTRVEIWSLSPDGKQLMINKKSIETRSENWEVNGVFVRKFEDDF